MRDVEPSVAVLVDELVKGEAERENEVEEAAIRLFAASGDVGGLAQQMLRGLGSPPRRH